jgi:serine/threonine protein kinase
VDLWAAGLLLFAFLAGDFPYAEDDLWGDPESVDVSGLTKKAILELDGRLTTEGSSVPRALLDGLLDADPAGRLEVSAALQDPWLTRMNGTMTASSYSAAKNTISASKEAELPMNGARYYSAAATKSSASKEIKVRTNDARNKAAAEYLKSRPFPLDDDYNAAKTTSSALKEKESPTRGARYYNKAVMKSSTSKEISPTNEARFNFAEEYLKSVRE